MRNPDYLLTDENYNARGFVELGERAPGYDGKQRAVGYDTTGRKMFDRKDLSSAVKAAELKGMRVVTTGYYGLSSRPEGVSAPENMRRRQTEKAEQERRRLAPPPKPLGVEAGRLGRVAREDVIGEVTQAPRGNSVLRVGSTIADGGWVQSLHVVLTPAERERLIAELIEHRAKAPATTEAVTA